jgi:hypothetical protein
MKLHHRIIVLLSLAVIVLGSLYIAYETFLDGTIISPAVVYNMTQVTSTVEPTGNFSLISGTVVSSYYMATDRTFYKPGDVIYGIWSGCKYRQMNVVVQWAFVNDIAQTLPARPGALMVLGCYTQVKVPIAIVPQEFQSADKGAKYRLYGFVTGQPNPFRTISYTFITNQFTVN